MVYFNCDGCGESLKKNQVEKHRQKCYHCHMLTCLDCNKDFRGNDYEQHTKCVSEEERYSGKGFKPKPNANKGELKQELWFQQVQEAICRAKTNHKLRAILEQLKNYPNVPRKKPKFENFVCNSLHVRDRQLASEVWNAISAQFNNNNNSSSIQMPANGNSETTAAAETVNSVSIANNADEQQRICVKQVSSNGTGMNKDKKTNKRRLNVEEINEVIVAADEIDFVEDGKKKKKRKVEEVESESEDSISDKKKLKIKRKMDNLSTDDNKTSKQRLDQVETPDDEKHKTKIVQDVTQSTKSDVIAEQSSFKWDAVIINVLKRAPDNQLKLKKLRKKVLSEFSAHSFGGKAYKQEKLFAKFTHKVNKCRQLKLHKDCVKLVS